jgi:hypothetical protein
MRSNGSRLAILLKLAIAAAVVCVALGAQQGFRALKAAYTPRVPASARNLLPADAPTIRARAQGPVTRTGFRMAPESALAPPGRAQLPAGVVDSAEYLDELTRVASLSETEQARMRDFLGLISRSQAKVDRVMDGARRRELDQRLQYQTEYGIRIRIAPERRKSVDAMLERGVPRLSVSDVPASAKP